MNHIIRILASATLGFVIVVTLVLMMLRLLSQDNTIERSPETTIEMIKFSEPAQTTKKLKPIKIEKKKHRKPKLAQAPSLELADKGSFESSQQVNDTIDVSATEYGIDSTGNKGDTIGVDNLNTGYMAKYYEHNLKFPDEAKKAGILTGTLTTRAIFGKKHEFLRFEILEEQPKLIFRSVLYQLKFVRNDSAHLFHPKYNVEKGIARDAKSIHSSTYKFVFDLNSSEPVKFYLSNSH
jgi:hypothetical protein